jgi:hypothetical protein
MASVLHGSARTTPRIRAGLKAAQAPARLLASQYGLNVKTVLKWRGRFESTDAPMGPKAKSTVLTPTEEAIIVEFRYRTLLPLDDVLGCLKDTIPNLSRSALHRCLQRHGISRPVRCRKSASGSKPTTLDMFTSIAPNSPTPTADATMFGSARHFAAWLGLTVQGRFHRRQTRPERRLQDG